MAGERPTVAGHGRRRRDAHARSPGTWTPVPTRLLYQWTADGQVLEGATTPTLTPGPELVGKALGVTVTARKWGYDPVTLSSAPTPPVASGTLAATVAPSLSGLPRLGETLSLDPGSYTPEGTVAVQWRRDGVAGAGRDRHGVPADAGRPRHPDQRHHHRRRGPATPRSPRRCRPPGRSGRRRRLTASILTGARRDRIEVTVRAPGVAHGHRARPGQAARGDARRATLVDGTRAPGAARDRVRAPDVPDRVRRQPQRPGQRRVARAGGPLSRRVLVFRDRGAA